MDEATKKRLADGLEQAIKAETDGYHFYMMAARSTDDPKGREVFESLAQDELEHVRYLRLNYRSVMETGELDVNAKLGRPTSLEGDSPIFSDGLRQRVGGAHFEMSALSIGIQLELDARKYYTEQAESASSEAVKKFFMALADWESGHYHALLRQQEALKEDYWAEGGFSPF